MESVFRVFLFVFLRVSVLAPSVEQWQPIEQRLRDCEEPL
jgi:hypothetical protein